jgi:hypothetical protein
VLKGRGLAHGAKDAAGDGDMVGGGSDVGEEWIRVGEPRTGNLSNRVAA